MFCDQLTENKLSIAIIGIKKFNFIFIIYSMQWIAQYKTFLIKIQNIFNKFTEL